MNRFLCITSCVACVIASWGENIVFDFHNPTSLTPSIAEPGVKESIDLDGKTFTEGNVSVSFAASGENNAQVRIYHSYDAGVDLRLYNNDVMTVSVDGENYISQIQFTMSLSGAATGTADINFIPSTGEFVWETETWSADTDFTPKTVELTSSLQSRIYTMTVTTESIASINEIKEADVPVRYYSILGHRLPGKPSRPGVYLAIGNDGTARKIILR